MLFLCLCCFRAPSLVWANSNASILGGCRSLWLLKLELGDTS